ncbi:hypothetical protein P9D39_03710 [Heyndrickxia oleronia]|uniref:Uncharacterized protein n=1 Tax=Heyndrickxia oleronia TaxID=38875 RepID=A0AAW6SU34_9BACI|nr:hypothetical protein [Heyndrickxia oleronia]MDH5160336.1 hypothetical protein [Heyndrickxia oleronia]MEC1373418.1 hypothetical protein [Heyndrickxia oleronia]
MAQNKVIAGEYEGKNILLSKQSLFGKEEVFLFTGFTKKFPLNKDTVSSYELITEEHRKSAVSGVSRGLVGGALLGPVGLLAGLSAKNKGTHTLAIEFKDGKKSLIEINEKLYKTLIKSLF